MRRINALFFAVILVGFVTLALGQEAAPGVTIHVVQRGENLFRIALRYGMTTDELARLNGIVDVSNIQVGQRLLVPVSETPHTQFHVVRAGETLKSIASLYNKTVEELTTLNSLLDPNTIYVGQTLTINPADFVLPALSENAAETSRLFDTNDTHTVIHVVQTGETLFRIAQAYGLTVNELSRANSLADPTLIYAGQQLVIPGVEPPQLAFDLPEPVSSFDITPVILMGGKTGRIRLGTRTAVTVTGTFLGQNLRGAPERDGTLNTILVGIPITTPSNIYPLVLTTTSAAGQVASFTVNVQVIAGNYGSQNITLPQDKAVLLAPAVEENEINILQNITSVYTIERYFNGPMGLPAAAAMNSPFGTLRSYNGGPFDTYHRGADFAGAPGTAVLAAAAGRVVLADTLNIRGIATVIDHGWGVFTTYSHQAESYVRLGDFVATGQVIGSIGASGRATGAHLHWEIWLNGIPVDPMQWVSQSFP